MADFKKRVKENVEGEFFVDHTCIDCDACRQLAPRVFADAGNTSFVKTQPQTPKEIREATQALLACPTGSIGTLHPNQSSQVLQDFPLEIEKNVYYCGFNSAKSYGANSYFIRHPDGNWLIDSPKFLSPLVKKFAEMGGLHTIFLTHQDDVADAASYAQHFKSRRIIHEADRRSQPDAEMMIQGMDPMELSKEFKIIPTPGHTRGHCVLLYQDKYLFTGDHLWWSCEKNQLGASRGVAWYSWREQTQSMSNLLNYRFEWILPGHGGRKKLSSAQMRQEMTTLVQRMKASLDSRETGTGGLSMLD